MGRMSLVYSLFSDTGYNANVMLTLSYLILLLFFRKRQPVKSRLPLLALNAASVFFISCVVVLLQTIRKGIDLHDTNNTAINRTKSTVRLDNTLLAVKALQQILVAFCMCVYCLHIARFYYLKNLYAFISKKEKIEPSDFSLHRKFTSNIAFTIYSIIIFLLILAAFIPLTVKKNIEFYNSVTVTSLDIIVYVIRTIVLLVVAVCFFWDLLSNAKRIFEKGYKFI